VSPGSVFLLLRCLASLPPSACPGYIGLHHTGTPHLGIHPPAPLAGTLLPLTVAGPSTAEWLSSLSASSGPPHAPKISSTLANLAFSYPVSWYCTTSLANAKVPRAAAPRPWRLGIEPAPEASWFRVSSFFVTGGAIVVVFCVSVGTCCHSKSFLLCWGAC